MFYLLLTEDNSYPGADYDTQDFPNFELETLLGKKIVNTNINDKTFLLNVWASWCITCRVEHPYLMYLNKQGIPILGLNYKDEKEDAINWLKKYGNPYKDNIHDYKGSLALDLGSFLGLFLVLCLGVFPWTLPWPWGIYLESSLALGP